MCIVQKSLPISILVAREKTLTIQWKNWTESLLSDQNYHHQ